MGDDPKPRRPRSVWGDQERASAKKMSRTPSRGVPIGESWDDDKTPPPQAVPIVGEIHERLDLLADGFGNLTEAVGKLWDERGNGDRLTRIESALTGYTTQLARQQETLDGLLVPSVKALMASADAEGRARARTDALLEQIETSLEGIAETLKDVVTRIGRLELTVERLAASDQSLEARLEASLRIQNALDVKQTALEQRLVALEHKSTAMVAADGERKRIVTGARVAIAGVAGAVGWIAEKFIG